ncbi:hypothetical protein THAOC_10443 [Thalassiosira oceanica]|uniref:Uncharacterized protein n=1 Tax=Thalassiosira oceanica TaxID=159749 RepID=K0TD05_THAOC|nr:hypothetical protein THAOC_10443 [Thalassiosira oceanica]|eukprot:EJK68382.1 hypothetical protein THAOC_10443 [Thalassiosira oceanica]
MKRRRSILAAATLLVGEECTSYVPPVTSRMGISFVQLNRGGVRRCAAADFMFRLKYTHASSCCNNVTGSRGHNRLLSNFYDDWEEFSDFDSSSSGDDGSKKERNPGDSSSMDSVGDDNSISATDDAVMKSLRERMNDLNTSDEKEEDGDDEEDIFVDDGDSGT